MLYIGNINYKGDLVQVFLTDVSSKEDLMVVECHLFTEFFDDLHLLKTFRGMGRTVFEAVRNALQPHRNLCKGSEGPHSAF